MSEILITGLTLPKKGEKVTIELFSDGLWCDYNNNNYHGKAIELQPHGRLGDLDALQKQIEDDIEAVAKEKGKVGLRELWQILNKNLEDAPTII